MKQIYVFVMILVGFLLSGCSNEAQIKAWSMIDDGAFLVDVRTQGEFRSGHLPGARLIPVDTIPNKLSAFGPDKDRPIVVYCKSGSRSSRAEGILKAAGYTNIIDGGGYSSLMSVKKKLDSGEIKPKTDV